MVARRVAGAIRVAIQCVLAVASALSIAENCQGEPKTAKTAESSDAKADQAAQQPKWLDDVAENLDAFRALFKPDAYGARGAEIEQYYRPGFKGGEQRIAQLRTAIEKYPDSPFADDAALLLARAYFLYDGDAAKATAELNAVVQKYPDGEWLAEDPIVIEDIATISRRGDRKRFEAYLTLRPDANETMRSMVTYMDYVSRHPNFTSDEARYWIAWMIFRTKDKARYQEAEDLLRGTIAKYRDVGRTQADLRAVKDLDNRLLLRVPRSEREASKLLIELLLLEGKKPAAVEAAQEYARLYDGHPSVKSMLDRVEHAKAD